MEFSALHLHTSFFRMGFEEEAIAEGRKEVRSRLLNVKRERLNVLLPVRSRSQKEGRKELRSLKEVRLLNVLLPVPLSNNKFLPSPLFKICSSTKIPPSMAAIPTLPENLTREQYVYMAKLAEQAERYEEMVKFMEKLVVGLTPASELTVEERNLLSVAYKNVIGSLRAAWRIVSSIEQKEESRKNDDHVVLVKDYRSKVENELKDLCAGILKLLESNLVPSASSGESKVFYLKMKGDYHRYLAEFEVGDERKEAAEDAMNSYKAAQEIAATDMAPTHPIRLGLALNFSVFYYEILNSSDKACSMAKQAFEEAIAELDTLGEESYKDSTLIMQLLRDNLTLWTSDAQEQLDEP
ncbi:hypothetical protein LXL04_030173 [Taraxacum kok-saghyz]